MLRSLSLSVANVQVSRDFYVGHLGMDCVEERPGQCQLTFSSNSSIRLVLNEVSDDKALATFGREHTPSQKHSYWKIGLCVDNVAASAARLQLAGVGTTAAALFEDIGVLCHLSDPDGYTIELLQRRFEVSVSTQQTQPVIGQVSLRVADIAASLAFYQQYANLACVSVQSVAAYGFTLYFLAPLPAAGELPPDLAVDPVAHREWLWQRRYTHLELQHYDDGRGFQQYPGLRELCLTGNGCEQESLLDPDGHPIRLQN